ncbi:hypothetical protein RIF29_22022 [Crotalaria pallida]|uniref:Reverse transcriptase zinc-binding domain-containing protein n=1 Tax=Crotalaria pallida TaxID=3830 RepID=A0AAN9F5V4_CROPI
MGLPIAILKRECNFSVLGSGGRRSEESRWWRDLCCVSEGDLQNKNWFLSNVRRSIGDGAAASFWHEAWCDDECLKSKYPRLFSIADSKSGTVAEAGLFEDGVWKWNLRWRRLFFQWEEELGADLLRRIQPLCCFRDKKDGWRWVLETDGRFSVRSAYVFLARHYSMPHSVCYSKAWNRFIPSKVSALMWKILQGRLPTKIALQRRCIIPQSESVLCVFCHRHAESVDHLFLECEFSQRIWHGCYKWLGISCVLPTSCKDHFVQHCSMWNYKKCRKIWRLLWGTTVWSLWLLRNEIVFSNACVDYIHLLDLIQVRSWRWVSAKVGHTHYGFVQWYIDPMTCITSAMSKS